MRLAGRLIFLDETWTSTAMTRRYAWADIGARAGSDKGGERAATLATLIETAKLNSVDPEGWLSDVLARIAEHPINRIEEFFPWNWRDNERGDKLAA